MKNYLLILLLTLGLSLFATAFTPELNTELEVAPEYNYATEVALLSEITPAEEIETSEIAAANTVSAPTKTSTSSTASGIDYYAISTSSTGEDCNNLASDQVYHVSNLLYAHANRAFKNLKYFTIGTTFTVSENGIISTYRVSEIRYFKKINATTLNLCFDGLENCQGQNQMGLIKKGRFLDENSNQKAYSIALMTCAGVNDSHRLVVFANKI